MALGEYIDLDFGGISQIVDYLKTVTDVGIVWKYAKVLLKLDPAQGIAIFTSRASEERFKPDDVISYLQQHHPPSLSLYYEYLIYETGLQVRSCVEASMLLYVMVALILTFKSFHQNAGCRETYQPLCDLCR